MNLHANAEEHMKTHALDTIILKLNVDANSDMFMQEYVLDMKM
jgi:hypothetical protein